MSRLASTGLALVVMMSCMTLSAHFSVAQYAPAPGPDCTNELIQMAPCLEFLTNSSIANAPTACCSAIANISTASPFCLCSLITPGNENQGALLGINITRALQLPTFCSLNVSPASCNAILGPISAPVPTAGGQVPVLPPTPVAPGPVSPTTPAAAPDVSTTPAPASDCGATALQSLLSCQDYLQEKDNSPPASCCKGLGDVVKENPSCLCSLASTSNPLIQNINTTRALGLPAYCAVPFSVGDCAAALGPGVAGPGASPEGSSDGLSQAVSRSSLFIALSVAGMSFFYSELRHFL